jgi:excisionase family DNA binding protein
MRLNGQTGSDSQVLNASEVSEMLKIHTTTLYRMVREGKIPSFRVGTEWRFRLDEIERWMNEQRPQ